MIARYKTDNGEKIIETEYLEIEDVDTTEVKDGKWVFKDGIH